MSTRGTPWDPVVFVGDDDDWIPPGPGRPPLPRDPVNDPPPAPVDPTPQLPSIPRVAWVVLGLVAAYWLLRDDD